MLNISSGKVARPVKLVIYGPEGIGKTTLASQAPDPLFIDTEGGTAHLDVRRVQQPESWESLISTVEEVAAAPGICKTLVLDTADWAELSCVSEVCAKYKKTSIEEFGYGKGYTYLGEEFCRLLNALNKVVDAGMNVVVTAHAKMRKFEQPDEMGAYDRWEMKLSKQVAPLIKEWCDALLFVTYKTVVVSQNNNVKKAQGGKRVIYANHHPCWDAKNRHGLPDELDLDFGAIARLFSSSDGVPPVHGNTSTARVPSETAQPVHEDTSSARAKLKALMDERHIVELELQEVVAAKGHFPAEMPVAQYPDAFITGWVLPCWEQIAETIEADPNRLPF